MSASIRTMSSFLSTGRKIVAIGRNYAAHAKELNNAVPKEPFFFLKPTSSYVTPGQGAVEIPKGVIAHHEVELAVVIGSEARNVKAAEADSHIAGYALSIDMTGRNVQDAAKAKGMPWSTAKGFDTFTPIGPFIPKSMIPDLKKAAVGLTLSVDGKQKQAGVTSDMLFDIPQLIEFVSGIMKLEAGDVVLTGTPSGVGPVVAGQTIHASLTYPGLEGKELSSFEIKVVDKQGGYEFKA